MFSIFSFYKLYFRNQRDVSFGGGIIQKVITKTQTLNSNDIMSIAFLLEEKSNTVFDAYSLIIPYDENISLKLNQV